MQSDFHHGLLRSRIRALTDLELAALELALDEALGRVEPERG
jgi:hypothetical protein